MADEKVNGPEEGKGFKVFDRRFSVRGYGEVESSDEEPRREGPRKEEPPRPAEAAKPQAEEKPRGEKAESPGRREFDMLLAILQGNALAAMGLHPQTGERIGAADPRSARMFVDMVGMVKEKMKGNLTPEEERLLDQVFSDLQMLYVQQVGIG